FEAEALEPINLLGIVREQSDLAHSEVVKDLAADAVVALVRRVAERLVRLHGVHSLVLQVVRVKLVEEADASPLLVSDVEAYACAFFRNRLHGRFELRAAVAPEAAEDVTGQALGVGSQEDGFCGIDLAEDNREVVLMTQEVLIGV